MQNSLSIIHARSSCLLKSKEPCGAPANQLSQRRLHFARLTRATPLSLPMYPSVEPESLMPQMSNKPHCVTKDWNR